MGARARRTMKSTRRIPREEEAKITPEEFVLRSILALRKPPHKGIHVVFSGFNAAFREYFGSDADPQDTIESMVSEGTLVCRPTKGGALIYRPGEGAPAVEPSDVLSKILAKKQKK